MASKQPQQKEKSQSPAQQKEKSQNPAHQKSSGPKQSGPVIPFIFDKTNYMIMVGGLAVIIIGFMLMSGGATTDKSIFPKEEIYSFRRITLAPIVIMIGFAIEIYAILKRPEGQ